MNPVAPSSSSTGGGASSAASGAVPSRLAGSGTGALLKAVQQIFPVEEPEPAGLNAVLRSYQKQSLAFMLRNERRPESSEYVGKVPGRTYRGGFLSSEGTTAINHKNT